MINKPISGKKSILTSIVSDKELQTIENARDNFFDQLMKKSKPPVTSVAKLNKKSVNQALKNPNNIFFQTVKKVIDKNAEQFINKFLNLIFRTGLKELENTKEFQFFLLTGIGKFTKTGLNVNEPSVIDLPNIMERLTELFSKKNKLHIGTSIDAKGKERVQAWEKGAKASKIFFTIYEGLIPLISIEIRYKGTYTSAPQLQAYVTPHFKEIFKGK